jgi:hypothetical protein
MSRRRLDSRDDGVDVQLAKAGVSDFALMYRRG